MPNNFRELAKARDAYFLRDVVPRPSVVRPMIFESWRRSRMHGLYANDVLPARACHIRIESALARAARRVVPRQAGRLEDFGCALSVIDTDGCILGVWTTNGVIGEAMRAWRVAPGYNLAERAIGTSASGIAIAIGGSAMVVGPEHFAAPGTHGSSASAAVRHPVTGALLGAVTMSCALKDSSPLMLRWVEDRARELQTHIALDGALGGPARRRLTGLERSEAHAITAALRAAGGNKKAAAASLGIARSTLYRKVRALGLASVGG